MSTIKNLQNKKCYACDSDTQPLDFSSIKIYKDQLKSAWQITDNKKIDQTFEFKDFKEAINFINLVAKIAENEGHHPDIGIYYNKVKISLWTHSIDGLSENDFIMAAKIENLSLVH